MTKMCKIKGIIKRCAACVILAAFTVCAAGNSGLSDFWRQTAYAEDPDGGHSTDIVVPEDAFVVDLEHSGKARGSCAISPEYVAVGSSIFLYEPENGEHVFLEIDNITEETRIELNGVVLETAVVCRYGTLSLDVTDYIKKGVNNLDITCGETEVSEAMGEIRMTTRPAISVSDIKIIPSIEDESVSVQYTVTNYTDEDYAGNVEISIYELGHIDGGTFSLHTGAGYVAAETEVSANSHLSTETTLKVLNIETSKYWTTDNPYLYELTVSVEDDSETEAFAMRELQADTSDGYITMNGTPAMLFGAEINVADMTVKYGELMEKADFAAAVIAKMKSVGWNTIRTCGILPECWYDIADEDGIVIITGYYYSEEDSRTQEKLVKEVTETVNALTEHPSAVAWEITGRTDKTDVIKALAAAMRNADPQERPVSTPIEIEPQFENSLIECDVSMLTAELKPEDIDIETFTTRYSPKAFSWNVRDYENIKIITGIADNFALDSDGGVLYDSAALWDAWLPGAGESARLEYYDRVLALLVEYWRAGGRYSGIILPYEVFSCVTVKTGNSLAFRENAEEALSSAFSPVGLSIEYYCSELGRGEEISFDIMVINDTNEDITDLDVNVQLVSNGTEIYSDVKNYDSIKKLGTSGRNIVRRTATMTIPSTIKDDTEITLIVSFVYGGVTVSSERQFTVAGGDEFMTPMSGVIGVIAVGVAGTFVLLSCAWAFIRQRRMKKKTQS